MARNNNKINYPTNVVNPITYATYMQMIASQPDGQVAVSYASNTLFPSIKYGKDEEGKKDTTATAKKDTHTIGVLLDYGLAEYVKNIDEKTVRLTHFGKRFLEVFTKKSEEDAVVMNRKEDVDINYNALMLEILLNWRTKVGDKVFYPGALLVCLLMDERLDYKFNAYEWAFICENEEFIKTNDYDKLVSDILTFRTSGKEIELKKAHDFCNSLANSWTLLIKNKEKFYLLRELTIENIKDWKKNNKDLVFSADYDPEDISIDFPDICEDDISDGEDPEQESTSEDQNSFPDAKICCLDIVRTPRTNKVHPLNFIVYGAPGTGKTYSTVEYALAIIDNVSIEKFKEDNSDRKINIARYKALVKNGQIVFTTFHQNYGYEDFIQGIRPDTSANEMSFKTVDGVFKVIADEAMQHPEKDYVIIIDEINRANISKVFGELITLIEDDKRWGEENAINVTLPSGETFAVPNNLYIIGTMNSADKSISLIDAALRRRFEFIEYVPNLSLISDTQLRSVLKRLNESIADELGSTDLLVGHSYFMHKSADDICDIMNRSIIPLLYEYFFDNQKKVEAQIKKATEGMNVEVKSGSMGRIKLVKKDAE